MTPADELQAERYTKTLLLLDRVARGEGTMEIAQELACEMGIQYKPIQKPRPIPEWDGTCNPF